MVSASFPAPFLLVASSERAVVATATLILAKSRSGDGPTPSSQGATYGAGDTWLCNARLIKKPHNPSPSQCSYPSCSLWKPHPAVLHSREEQLKSQSYPQIPKPPLNPNPTPKSQSDPQIPKPLLNPNPTPCRVTSALSQLLNPKSPSNRI